MFRIAFLALFFILPVFGNEPKPEPISDEKFVAEIKAGIESAHSQNPNFKLLGFGTADLLDSGRPSKIGCGKSNPSPKEGECSGAYPIYPEAKPLAEVVTKEKKVAAKAKHIPTVWVAWRDCEGTITIAFNGRAGAYEATTPCEVEKDGVWSGKTIYYISGKIRPDEWQTWIEAHESAFTRANMGKGDEQDFPARLQALQDLHVIANVKASTVATTVTPK